MEGDEGVIRYTLHWQHKALEGWDGEELIGYRNRLAGLGWIGAYPDGTGYGNISMRSGNFSFYISGSQTGHIPHADESLFAHVLSFDLERREVFAEGPVKPSSEALTHAMCYVCDPAIGSVIHVHHAKLWEAGRDILPTTAADIPYGSRALQDAVYGMMQSGDLRKERILVTAGHREGVFTFGKDGKEAFNVLMQKMNLLKVC